MIAVAVLVVTVTLTLSYLACQRNRWRRRVVWVELLRLVLVLAALFLFWQPESTYRVANSAPRQVVVLLDHSKSMQTRDVPLDGTFETRSQIVSRVAEDPAWGRLEPRFEMVQDLFSVDSPTSSPIGEMLDLAVERYERSAAIVLVSDGDWSGERSPVQSAAEQHAAAGGDLSFFAVATGRSTRVPDLELVSANVPTFGVIEKPVRIPFTVRNWFDEQREVRVQLSVDGQVVDERRVSLRAGGRLDDAFAWQSREAGEFDLSIEVETIQGEATLSNNRIEKPIEIRTEKLRALLIDAIPRWEFRYIRNALLRDPGIDVSCLLYHPGLPKVGGGGSDYLSEFPTEASRLASYDVIFVGDVGAKNDQLTLEQCRQISGLVRQQAVGLVLMPGMLGNHQSLLGTDLEDLYPVLLDENQPRGIGSEVPANFSLTGIGRRSLLTQLDDDDRTNWSVWESLPGFYWHAAVQRAKAGVEVLAVHSTSSNQYGRLPLLASRSVGAGKVLFMGTASAWRWRRGVEDKYHYRFWGQVIRWMAYQRNMAVGESMRFTYRPEQPRALEQVALRASVMNAAGNPSDAPVVDVQCVAPNGSVRTVQLQKADDQWGVYTGQMEFEIGGEHLLRLSHPEDDGLIEARVAVQGRASEQIGRPARVDVMREIARVGGGQMYSHRQIDELVATLNRLPKDALQLRRVQWWNHPLVLFTMIAMLGLFWVGRKWAGQV